MKRIPSTVLISIGLAALTFALLMTGSSLGIVPDDRAAMLKEHARFSELLAAMCTPGVMTSDTVGLDELIQHVVGPESSIVRVRLVDAHGKLLAERDRRGNAGSLQADPVNVITVAIPGEHHDVGRIELEFAGESGMAWMKWLPAPLAVFLSTSVLRLAVFVTCCGFVLYILYLRLVLRHLDPSTVIPPRVKAMLDVMSEGIIILDRAERIVMANESFRRSSGLAAEQLTGRNASKFKWINPIDGSEIATLPWTQAISTGNTVRGLPVGLVSGDPAQNAAEPGPMPHRKFMVNSTPIMASGGRARGVLASFDDVTEVERMNELLSKSNAEVERANIELLRLATTDPLTGCLNRRSFFSKVDAMLTIAARNKLAFACIMVDVDHFKSINDRFGHADGDAVLKVVATILATTCRDEDMLCRNGGEEFCVFISDTTPAGAARAAERMRSAIEAGPWPTVAVTASLGLCFSADEYTNFAAILSRADQALYTSKRSGRNRVTTWGDGSELFQRPELRVSRRESAA